MYRICTIVLFWLLSFGSAVSSPHESVKFGHFQIEDGLSNNAVRCILQDRFGYMWFGTFDGLNRYDGYTFKIFKHDPADSTTIGNNRIESIYEDEDGILWIGLFNGEVDRYNCETENFTRYTMRNNMNFQGVKIFAQLDNKDLFLKIGGRGIYRLQVDSGNFEWINPNQPNETITHELIRLMQYPLYHGYELDSTLQNLFAHKGKITETSFDQSLELLLKPGFIQSAYRIESGEFWVGTRKGLFFLDANQKIIRIFKHDPVNQNSLTGDYIYSLFCDRLGILWIGTKRSGLNKLNLNSKPFKFLNDFGNPASGLTSNLVRAILEDKSGKLWVGTSGTGITVIDPQNNNRSYYNTDNSRLSSDEILHLFQDHKGNIWIGTSGGSLNKLQFVDGQPIFEHFDEKNGLLNPQTYRIVEKDLGILWLATVNGLCRLSLDSEEIICYPEGPEPVGLSHPRVQSLYIDKEGTLWIGTWGGLNRLIRKENSILEFKHYKHDPKRVNCISNDIIFSIYEDAEGILWIGTADGLNRYDKRTEIFTCFREQDGLTGSRIYGILGDDEGSIWMSTNHGISKYTPSKKLFQYYNIHDNLQGTEFLEDAYYRSSTGELFFGGSRGLNHFYPADIQDNLCIVQVRITDVLLSNESIPINGMVNGRKILDKAVGMKKEITFSYKDSFTFEFAAMDYTIPEKNKYKYILEGHDEEWNNTDFYHRYANYTCLNPGNYIFKVKATNNDGIWNNQATMINVKITPPFWLTGWAYCLYLVIGFGLLLSVYCITILLASKKHQLELANLERQQVENINEMKLRFFTNISHEFRTPLTLILAPIEQMISMVNDNEPLKKHIQMIQRNAERLRFLIDELMYFRKIEQDKIDINVKKINIVSFLHDVCQPFEELAKIYEIHFQINSQNPIIDVWFDPDKMEKIINNLLSNAFKFTPHQGRVLLEIDVRMKDELISRQLKQEENPKEFVEISVFDTGIGISRDKIRQIFDRYYQVGENYTGTGIGLHIAKSLVELHGGEIDVSSEEGMGSCFRIRIPLGNGHLDNKKIDFKVNHDPIHKSDIESINTIEKETSPEDIMESKSDSNNGDNELQDNRCIILIVENDKDMRTFMKLNLNDKYRIVEAVNGIEGYKKAMQVMPDLIISDIVMYEMDGIQLCEKLKNDMHTSHIPIILLTAMSSTEYQLEGLGKGADAYIVKPFDFRYLEVRIEKLIETRRVLRDHFKLELILEPHNLQIDSIDERFLQRCMKVIEKNMHDENFGVEELGKELGISRIHLYRKLKVIAGQTPRELIHAVRMKRAIQLLRQEKFTVSEISYLVGFKEPSTFCTSFRHKYGKAPLDYIASL